MISITRLQSWNYLRKQGSGGGAEWERRWRRRGEEAVAQQGSGGGAAGERRRRSWEAAEVQEGRVRQTCIEADTAAPEEDPERPDLRSVG